MAIVGVVLLIVGVLLAIGEAHNPSHGVIGGTGVAVMAVGLALALAGAGVAVVIGVASGAVLAAAGGGALATAVIRSGAVRHRRVRGGAEGLIGQVGTVRDWERTCGRVALDGGLWDARRSPAPVEEEDAADEQLHAGDRVVVERLNGLTLSVRPAEEWELI
jgi:membrane-bound serine protease (ClpP class)